MICKKTCWNELPAAARRVEIALTLVCLLAACSASPVPEIPVVEPEAVSPPWTERLKDRGSPDADDPAIWVNHRHPERSLMLGTLKNAGMLVATLGGEFVQIVRPPNVAEGAFDDSTSPAQSGPCRESESGKIFGRFNNVDVAYGFRLHDRSVDLAVLTDRGCDRLRFYSIDPTSELPLTDVTSPAVGRVFPTRFLQPSPLQPFPQDAGGRDNPLDDKDTAYGLGLWQDGEQLFAFVSQRNRSMVAQLRIERAPGGGVGYSHRRTFLFDANFTLSCGEPARNLGWTPCREDAREDPQAEGLVVDAERRILYVGMENIGVYRIPLRDDLPPVVRIGPEALLDRVRSFGQRYRATPEKEAFLCEFEPTGVKSPDAVVADGCPATPGPHLVADVEGLALYPDGAGSGYLLVSSQGDSTFQVYERGGTNRYVGAFRVAGVKETDGLEVVSGTLGATFPAGLLVVQNGRAPASRRSHNILGRRVYSSSQFAFVRWDRVAALFDPPLVVNRELPQSSDGTEGRR